MTSVASPKDDYGIIQGPGAANHATPRLPCIKGLALSNKGSSARPDGMGKVLPNANALACGISMGSKGARIGWALGKFTATSLHAQYSHFLYMLDLMYAMRIRPPALWVRACLYSSLSLASRNVFTEPC